MSDIINGVFKKRKEKTEQEQIPADSECSEHQYLSKITLLATSEGKILIAGVVLALLYTAWIGVKFIFDPDKAQLISATTAFIILSGRAAGLALGFSLQFKPITVILMCIILETIQVLILYPLFVFSWRQLLVIKSLKRFFDKIQKAAVTHHDKVRKYGIIGLFAFVWFPFWMTGPVVGSVIGFMMALPAWLNLTIVLAGTYIAILCWAFFMHTVHQQIAGYGPLAGMILILIIILIIILGFLISKVRQKKKKKDSN